MLGMIAMEAAFRDGDDYMNQLVEYLRGNVNYFVEYINENIPGVHAIYPEGTYLAWVDFSGLGLDKNQLKDFMLNEARIATDFGEAFGTGADLFQRFNLACTRSVVEEALQRLAKAVRAQGQLAG